jgi:hypothetical protein
MTADPYNEKLDPKKDRLIDEKLMAAIQDAVWTVVSRTETRRNRKGPVVHLPSGTPESWVSIRQVTASAKIGGNSTHSPLGARSSHGRLDVKPMKKALCEKSQRA